MKSTLSPANRERLMAVNAIIAAAVRDTFAPSDDGKHEHDRVLAVNDSLITQANYSVPLTTYAVGYRDQAPLRELLNFLAPEVPTTRRFSYKQFNSADAFLSDDDGAGGDDARAPRGEFKTLQEAPSVEVNAKTTNRGLKIQVDEDQVVEQLNGADWKQFYTQRLMDRLARNSFRRAFALAVATAVSTGKVWGDSSNPDADIRAELRTAADIVGVRPNRVMYGETAVDYRLAAYEAQLTAGSIGAVNRDEARLAGYLGVDKVMNVGARYTSGASTKSQIVGANVLSFTAFDAMSKEDASNFKTFISPVEGGGFVRVFERQVGTKLWEIAVEKYEYTAVTSSLGVRVNPVTQS